MPSDARPLTYDVVGATRPHDPTWTDRPAGFRALATTVTVGRGDTAWRAAADAVLRWEVKTRSGFAVTPTDGGGLRAREGADYRLRAALGPVGVLEPVRVVAVVDSPMRCGFAYGTLPGHPVSGEEAFVVARDGDDVVLTLRSLTRPAPDGPWRPLFPALLLAQRVYRRRYVRALRRPRATS